MAVDKLDVLAKFRKGLTSAEISKIHDVKPEFIDKIIDEARSQKLITSMSQQDRAKLRKEIALYISGGKSVDEAMKKFKVTKSYVSRSCIEHEIQVPQDQKKRRVGGFKIVAALVEFSEMTEQQIADQFGVSKQYVNMVRTDASKEGLFLAIEKAKQKAIEEDRKERAREAKKK